MRLRVVLALLLVAAVGDARAEDPKEAAHKAFATGSGLYALGDFRPALESFKRSYLLYAAPETLYNIAQCHRQLGEHAEAVRLYKNYLELVPNAADRDEINRFIGEEQHAGTPVTPVIPPTVTPPVDQPRSERGPPGLALPVTVGVVAIAALATGLVLYLGARSDYDGLVPGCTPRCDPAALDPISTRADVSYALLAVGGVVAAVDVALWAWYGTSRRNALHVSVAGAPHEARLAVTGSW